jgi:hypothetical protein
MFLEIVKILQGVIQSFAFGNATAPVKVFDVIQNGHFRRVNSIQQECPVRFQKGSDVKLFPGRRNIGAQHDSDVPVLIG